LFALPLYASELYSVRVVDWLSISPVAGTTMNFDRSSFGLGDKLAARQWPCNQICVLCNQEQETAAHLILHCSFALSVWQKMQIWTQQLVQMPIGYSEIIDWWQKELAQLPKKTRRTKAAFMMYGAWNIWKERNRRIFEHKEGSPADVMHKIKTEAQARRLACGGPELP